MANGTGNEVFGGICVLLLLQLETSLPVAKCELYLLLFKNRLLKKYIKLTLLVSNNKTSAKQCPKIVVEVPSYQKSRPW